MGCRHLTENDLHPSGEGRNWLSYFFIKIYAMSSQAIKPIILNQKIALGDKKRLSPMFGTMWLQYSYIVATCQEKSGFCKKDKTPKLISAN